LPGPTDDPEKISGELPLSNDGISPQSSRIPSFSTDSWHRLAWIFALVAGAIAFRNLIPYEPFPADRPGPDPWEDWFFRPTGQSAPLIFGLSACFLYTRHRALAAALARPRGGGLGAALLIPATAFYFWATYTGAADLLLISLVGIALGIGAALGGRAGLRATFLPAVFLLLLVPIPAALLNQILYPMQLANAQASAFILNDLLGIPASSVGTVVTSGARTFQVIENCAGLRTISTLWMAAIVYADLFQRSRTETALLLLAAPLIGAVVNLGRVLSLMLNPASEIAAVHTTQGIIMTVVGVLLLAAVDSLLVRRFSADAAYLARWSAPPEPADQDGDDSALATLRNRRALAVLSFLAFLLVGGWAIQPWQPTPMLDWVPYRIPVEIDGWRGKPLKTDKHAMGSIHPNHGIHRSYTQGTRRVELFVATDNLGRRHTSLLSPRTVLPGPGFSIREQETLHLEGVAPPVVVSLLRRDFEEVVSYRWILGDPSLWREALGGFWAIEHSDLVPSRQLVLVRISTSVASPAAAERRRAEETLRSFSAALRPWLDAIEPPQPF